MLLFGVILIFVGLLTFVFIAQGELPTVFLPIVVVVIVGGFLFIVT